MKLPIHQVDAFTATLFRGNPAAVVTLDAWLPADLMQSIASENNLSETAFVIPRETDAPLRWFTPTVEVDLCGHATLAVAHVLFAHHFVGRGELTFDTRSGTLAVRRHGDILSLDLPSRPGTCIDVPAELTAALGARPAEAYLAGEATMAVFEAESAVRDLAPDFARVSALDTSAVIVTAPGSDVGFVSRFFAPAKGVPEDAVTGSAHCTLAPYWAERTGRRTLLARQLSARGGELECTVLADRVLISGRCVDYMRGEIELPKPPRA